MCLGAASAAGPIEPVDGLDAVAALFRYDDLIRPIVLSAKNRGRRDVLQQLGRLLAEQALVIQAAGPEPTPGFDLVTWVPASRAGRRRRGFDQGAVLASAVAAELGVRSRRLLLRRRGQAQIGRGRFERMDGPQIRAPLHCSARILLVDDVITTGASMSASANALRCSGATTVHGLAAAVVPI